MSDLLNNLAHYAILAATGYVVFALTGDGTAGVVAIFGVLIGEAHTLAWYQQRKDQKRRVRR